MQPRRVPSAIVCAAVAGWCALGTATTPLATAVPDDLPAPAGPLLGQSVDDLDKLAFDPSVGQIVCTGEGKSVQSVTPTEVRQMGQPCGPSENDSVMASPTDGHLIWCPSYRGIWTLFKP